MFFKAKVGSAFVLDRSLCRVQKLYKWAPSSLGRGLLGALGYFGVSHIESSEKEEMRTLALRGGEYNFEERQSLIITAKVMF